MMQGMAGQDGLLIREYSDELAQHFHDINAEWIRQMFRLEDTDVQVLSQPRQHILADGGAILFVERRGVGIVGACALRHTGQGHFELTKMGVRAEARGLKAGEFLLQAMLQRARALNARRVHLLTNAACAAAIHLYEKAGFEHDADILRDCGARYERCNVAMRLRDDLLQPGRETAVAARLWRGHVLENSHVAHVAVVDAQGRLLRSFGLPSRLTLARSAAKPAQALAIVETGALEQAGFDEADLALICASHSSEPRHVQRAAAMLARLGAREDDLACGAHPPASDVVQRSWTLQHFAPGPLCSNCSGKHVGMLAAAAAIGSPRSGYHLPDHPLQVRVKRTLAELCTLPPQGVQWAVDGCNLPTPAFPLDRLALLYARMADAVEPPAVLPGGGATAGLQQPDPMHAPGRRHALARIYQAMARHPELIGGEGRFCTALISAFEGGLIGKVGADASYAIGVAASAQTRALGAAGAMGIAIKVEDGNLPALHAIVCEVLSQLDIGRADQRARLAHFHRPVMHNTRGVVTGHLAPELVLAPAGAA